MISTQVSIIQSTVIQLLISNSSQLNVFGMWEENEHLLCHTEYDITQSTQHRYQTQDSLSMNQPYYPPSHCTTHIEMYKYSTLVLTYT